jgi:peptidyl-prolyl cis-trans isomerase C
MQKLLREPFFHFLLLGALIFVFYFIFNPVSESDTSNQILITQGDIDRFKQIFKKQWQRPPTDEELQGIIRSHLKEEILYREALAMGLDKDDTIVRRRLAQKVEFLISDISVPQEVEVEDLMTFYQENTDRYTRPAKLSFRHIYFNPDRRGERTPDEANATLQTLQATNADINVAEDLGDRFMFPLMYQHAFTDEISREFGQDFASNLATLTPGSWQGPVQSGYGLHLVFISKREATSIIPFAEVRERVKNDYLYDLRQQRNDDVLDKLKARYEIVIEGNGQS